MIPLRQALEDYLRIRRRVGFKLKADQRLLENFVDFLEQAGAERITAELALMWARRECHKVCVRQERMEPHAFNTRKEVLIPVSLF
jgi:hypothetical protein